MKIKNNVFLLCMAVNIFAYSMDERPYSAEEKLQVWLQKQMPADHPWAHKYRDDDEVNMADFPRRAAAKLKSY